MIDLESLKYAELQKLAKSHGLKANQKAAVLKEQLSKIVAAADGHTSSSVAAAELAVSSPGENKENVPLRGDLAADFQPPGSGASSPAATPNGGALPGPPVGSLAGQQQQSLGFGWSGAATPDGTAGCGDTAEQQWSPIVPTAASTPVAPSPLASDAMAAAVDSLLDGSLGLPPAACYSPTSPRAAAGGGADVTCDSELGLDPALAASRRRSSTRKLSCAGNGTFCIDDVSPTRSRGSSAAADCLSGAGQGRDLADFVSTNSLLLRRRRTFDKADDTLPSGAGDAALLPRCSREALDADDGASARRLRSSSSSSGNRACTLGAAQASPDLPKQRLQHGSSVPGRSTDAVAAAEARADGGGDDCGLLSSMKQEMSDNEMKASLLAALDRKAEQRQAEIAERLAKVRAAQDSGAKQLLKDRGGASKGNTPNFASIHAKHFAKMESIQSYLARKRQKLEDTNLVLGLSSPQLQKSSVDRQKNVSGRASASKDAKAMASASHMATATITPGVVFAFGSKQPSSNANGSAFSSSSSFQQQSAASSDASSRTLQEHRLGGGARIVKPVRGGAAHVARGLARAAGSGSVVTINKTSAAQHSVRPSSACPPAQKRPGMGGAWMPSSSAGRSRPGHSLQPKSSAAAAKQSLFGEGAAAASRTTSTTGIASSGCAVDRASSILNTTFTISQGAFDPQQTGHVKNAAVACEQPCGGPAKPTDVYKKPVLKTRDQRRAEVLASGKDKRLGALMQRRLADD